MAQEMTVSAAYRYLKSPNIKTRRRAKALIQAEKRKKKLKAAA